jgi:putative tryptophan/tyrosine transport system substrate-binding protein
MLRRRALITLIGAAAACPLAARAQQAPLPVIGFLHPSSTDTARLRAFRQGLKDAGFIEGENVAIEYRSADDQTDRLPALAAELAQRRVAVIAAIGGIPSALAAKAATTTIPIVFLVGIDPVGLGLVASLARPGGNLTGINVFASEMASKRLELLCALVPGATRIAVLVDPTNAPGTDATLRDVGAAARTMGLQIQVLNASTSLELDAVFATIVSERSDGLIVGSTQFLFDRRVQLAQLAARHAVPAIYQDRHHAEVGGLISYGASLGDAYRHVGVYTGRILKGAKPADLPVVQPTRFELVLNVPTARMLGLTVPDALLATADEVIE